MALKLHKFIKTRRIELGMSQRDLAAKCHLSHTTISKIEGGDVTPSTNTLNELSKALGVPFNNLLGLLNGREFKQEEDPKTLILQSQIEKLSPVNRQIVGGLVELMLQIQNKTE